MTSPTERKVKGATRRQVSVGLGALLSASGAPALAAPATLQSDLARELVALRKTYGFPGATAAFALADGSLIAAATGDADRESGRPMSPHSRMLAASIGKTFVSATTLALAHEGRLDLNDPVSKYLGQRKWFKRLPNHETMTVDQLLHHSSGLPDHVYTPEFARALASTWRSPRPMTPEQVVGFVLDKPALFKAGEGWAYTDTGYILVGMIIEQVSGQAYYNQVTRRFLRPLGLSLTGPSDRVDLRGIAAGYTDPKNEMGLPPKTTAPSGRMVWNPGLEWTGGGLASNSGDLARWALTLYEGRAMNWPYLPLLLKGVPVDPRDSTVRYGAGVSIVDAGPSGRSYGHAGWIPGYVSSMRYYADHRLAVAFQVNTDVDMMKAPAANPEDTAFSTMERRASPFAAIEHRLAALAIQRRA